MDYPIKLQLSETTVDVVRDGKQIPVHLTDLNNDEIDDLTSETNFGAIQESLVDTLSEMGEVVNKMSDFDKKMWNKMMIVNIRNLAIQFGLSGTYRF